MESATVGIVGLGLLGRGIAACFLSRGFRVVGCERDPKQREQAENYLAGALKDLVEHECMSAELLQTWRTTYLPVEFISNLGDCDFVIESIFEDLQAKQCAYDEIEAVIRPTVPIASNTSALPITQLQNGRRHPNRFIGMHWAFQWMDLTGLPAYAAVMKRLFPTLSNSTDVPEAIRKLVENGAQGIRNGRGFYNYSPEEARRWEQRLMDNVWRLRQIDDASSKSGDPKCD